MMALLIRKAFTYRPSTWMQRAFLCLLFAFPLSFVPPYIYADNDRSLPDGVTILVKGYKKKDIDAQGLLWSTGGTPDSIEKGLENCINAQLEGLAGSGRVVPSEQFYKIAYPNLTRYEAPRSYESLQILLAHPTFLKRISKLGLRYLVLVGGETKRKPPKGEIGFYGIGSYGGAIAWWWGKKVWTHNSNLSAFVLDLSTKQLKKQDTVNTDDESSFGMFLYLPYGLPSSAETNACKELAIQINQTIHELRARPPKSSLVHRSGKERLTDEYGGNSSNE